MDTIYEFYRGTALPNILLFGGTVQPKNMLFGRTVPPNNRLLGGTVPTNSTLFGRIPHSYKPYFISINRFLLYD